MVLCNNKVCPYLDCEQRYGHKDMDAPHDKITVADLQSSCMRLAKFLANQINNIRNV